MVVAGCSLLASPLASRADVQDRQDGADATGTEATQPGGADALFPTPPRVERFDNGLRVVTVPWDTPGIIAYYTVVRVGSRDEVEPGHSGFAHLFEHMMFRGTERFPEDVYEKTIQRFGADNNAYTTQDFTMYTVTAPAETLPKLMEVEADRFRRLEYTEAQFRTETGAVLGEYNKSASSPSLKMWEALSEIAFSRHTYGHTTLGYLRDIKKMPERLAYSRRFFERFYTPDNVTLVVAGDVDHERVVELARNEYGGWKGTRHDSQIPREPPPRDGAQRHLEWEGASPPRLLLGYRVPGFYGRARREKGRTEALRETAALQIVHGLAFSESAPLYQDLVVKQRALLDLSSWAGWFKRDPHLFVASATLKPGADGTAVLARIQRELDTIARGKTPDERVRAVQSHLRYALSTGLQTPDDVADLVGRFIAVGGSIDALYAYLEALAAVTPTDVAQAAKRYMTTDRRFVVTLAPEADEEDDASDGGKAGSAEAPREGSDER
jgi:zinc protease